MKGLSLPIEVIVVVIIALIVLIAIVAFFTQGINTSGQSMSTQEKWQRACSALKMRGSCERGGLTDVTKIIIDGTPMFTPEVANDDLCETIAGVTEAVECCILCCGSSSSGCGDGR